MAAVWEDEQHDDEMARRKENEVTTVIWVGKLHDLRGMRYTILGRMESRCRNVVPWGRTERRADGNCMKNKEEDRGRTELARNKQLDTVARMRNVTSELYYIASERSNMIPHLSLAQKRLLSSTYGIVPPEQSTAQRQHELRGRCTHIFHVLTFGCTELRERASVS